MHPCPQLPHSSPDGAQSTTAYSGTAANSPTPAPSTARMSHSLVARRVAPHTLGVVSLRTKHSKAFLNICPHGPSVMERMHGQSQSISPESPTAPRGSEMRGGPNSRWSLGVMTNTVSLPGTATRARWPRLGERTRVGSVVAHRRTENSHGSVHE